MDIQRVIDRSKARLLIGKAPKVAPRSGEAGYRLSRSSGSRACDARRGMPPRVGGRLRWRSGLVVYSGWAELAGDISV
jgi:hypothetical protein